MQVGDTMKKRCYILSLIFVFIDQIIKVLISSNMRLYESIKIIPNFFSITYVRNDGAAFSMFEGKQFLLILIAFITIGVLVSFIQKEEKITKLECIAFSFLLGGIIGNFIDRLIIGQVIDYLDFKIFSYNYPVFNLADSLIVCGVLLLIYLVIRSENSGSKGKGRKGKIGSVFGK